MSHFSGIAAFGPFVSWCRQCSYGTNHIMHWLRTRGQFRVLKSVTNFLYFQFVTWRFKSASLQSILLIWLSLNSATTSPFAFPRHNNQPFWIADQPYVKPLKTYVGNLPGFLLKISVCQYFQKYTTFLTHSCQVYCFTLNWYMKTELMCHLSHTCMVVQCWNCFRKCIAYCALRGYHMTIL